MIILIFYLFKIRSLFLSNKLNNLKNICHYGFQLEKGKKQFQVIISYFSRNMRKTMEFYKMIQSTSINPLKVPILIDGLMQ